MSAEKSREKKRKRLARHPLERDRLLVRNVDAAMDARLNMVLSPEGDYRMDDLPGHAHAFPRAESIRARMHPGRRLTRLAAHMSQRMRSAWHPDAESWVYAYAYHCVWPDGVGGPEDGIAGQRPWGKPVLKVGTVRGRRPSRRQAEHLGEFSEHFPGAWESQGRYVLDTPVLFLPIARAGGGRYLEDAVLDSLPEADHLCGEWFYDTLGTWKALAMWFVLCHGCEQTSQAKGVPHV